MRPSFARLSLYLVILSLSGVHAAVITASELKSSYDFVIVGGGTAGNVLANRLTESSNYHVLVLEAGPSTEDGTLAPLGTPILANTLTPNTPWDWNYTTVPQPGLNGRTFSYPRGYILGGSSAINYLLYTRGSADDFNKFASITNDDGWSWRNMLKYFKKSEKWSLPADGHNTTGRFDPTVHGYSGLINVTLSGYPSGIDNIMITATQQLGKPFQFNLDTNSGSPLGIGWIQTTVNGHIRSSSASSYLNPTTFRQRPNLSILLGTRVSRVLKTGVTRGIPAFRGVEFSASGGSLQSVTATKEVILSAGAIGTPHVLLNSGIGNSKELSAIGITPLVDLPDVGANFADHVFLPNHWRVNSTDTYDPFFQNATLREQVIEQWSLTGQGLPVDTIASQIGFFRIPQNSSIWSSYRDPSPGRQSPHYEHLYLNGAPTPFAPQGSHSFGITAVVMTPTSRGTIKLASADPFAAPLIDPAMHGTELDRLLMREAIKGALAFKKAPVFSGYVLPAPDVFTGITTDEELDAYIANSAGSVYHPGCTASMSPNQSNNGVTNPDLTVKKVSGLRVVDASVFPFLPAGHLQAPTYAFAERAADLIKGDYD